MHILVLDTETCNGFQEPLIYDLSYVILDTETGEIKERSFTIKDTFDDKKLFATAFYAYKCPLYESALKTKETKKVSFKRALRKLQRDMRKNNITQFYAYNSRFDSNAIETTAKRFGGKIKYHQHGDIMDFVAPIVNTNEYKEFCAQNGFMTAHKKPRPQRKAETVYRYLINNPLYNEQHIAIRDCEIEMTILCESLARNQEEVSLN